MVSCLFQKKPFMTFVKAGPIFTVCAPILLASQVASGTCASCAHPSNIPDSPVAEAPSASTVPTVLVVRMPVRSTSVRLAHPSKRYARVETLAASASVSTPFAPIPVKVALVRAVLPASMYEMSMALDVLPAQMPLTSNEVRRGMHAKA